MTDMNDSNFGVNVIARQTTYAQPREAIRKFALYNLSLELVYFNGP